MTLQEFIVELTIDYSVEFKRNDDKLILIIRDYVKDRKMQVQLELSTIEEIKTNFGVEVWDSLYKQITHEINKAENGDN